jgi:hypothetical protein
MKKCSKCKQPKTLKEFYYNKVNGHDRYCMDCRRTINRNRYKKVEVSAWRKALTFNTN